MITFFVPGEPQPFPKKRTSRSGMIYSHDPGGVKRGWMQVIEAYGRQAMNNNQLDEKEAVVLECVFFRTKPKSAPKKRLLPNTKPDLDNYAYAVSNALNGVAYHDDSRICRQVIEKRYADTDHPPGVRITIKQMEE